MRQKTFEFIDSHIRYRNIRTFYVAQVQAYFKINRMLDRNQRIEKINNILHVRNILRSVR